MNIHNKLIHGSIMSTLIAIAASCGGRQHPEPPPPPLSDCLMGDKLGIIDPRLSDPHGQGSDLLGLGFLDSRTFVRVDRFDITSLTDDAGMPIANVKISSRALTGVSARTAHPLDLNEWKGAVAVGQLRCTNPKYKGKAHRIKARILEVVPNSMPLGPLEHRLWVAYKLELELDDGRRFENVCRDKDDVAFPILGYWNDSGAYVRDPKRFSFACTRRHVATCLKQGYLDSSDAHDRMALLEACTRMMRADYCGDGASYTRDGTFISVWDNRDIATEVHRKPLVFEAAWNKNGMVCSSRLRWSEQEVGTPTCLRSRAMPRCNSAEQARALHPKEPLIFNDSCVEHPCTIDGLREGFPGSLDPAPPSPGPCPDAGDPRQEASSSQTRAP